MKMLKYSFFFFKQHLIFMHKICKWYHIAKHDTDLVRCELNRLYKLFNLCEYSTFIYFEMTTLLMNILKIDPFSFV